MGHQRRKNHPGRANPLPIFMLGTGLMVLGVVVVLLLPKPGAPSRTSEPSAIPAKVQYSAPELILFDLDGNSVSLADYLGKVVLVNNWATWCPPCRAEMPELEAYYQEHQDEDFVIIGIEAGEPDFVVEEFVQKTGLSFPIWLDPKNEALAVFQNQSLPNSYVIDRLGTVRLAWTGPITLKNLEKFVTPLVED